MTWDVLLETDQANIRYCKNCDRGVHFCKNEQELLIAMKADRCVAIKVEEGSKTINIIGGIAPAPYSTG